MKKMKRVISLVIVGMMILALFACGGNSNNSTNTTTDSNTDGSSTTSDDSGSSSSSTGDTFNLGAFLQITGGNSAYGTEARNSIQLAVERINEAGGFNGQQINLIVYDTQGSPEEAVKVVTKMIESDNLNACIGSINSSEVLAASGYLNDAGIPTLGLGTSATWMEEDWPYVFRPAMNNNTAAPLPVGMIEQLGIKSVAVFKGQDDASLNTAVAFNDACKEKGIEVVAEESYDATDTDFSAQIANMLAANPETVYISVIGETGPLIVKQLRQYGYSGLIFDKESFMMSQIEIAGAENANYILFANPYVTYPSAEECDIPAVKEFLELYTEKYGECAKTDSAYRGWDAMTTLEEAAKIAGSNDRDALKDAINQVNVAGLGGQLDYTTGTREGYATFNTFILLEQKNILFSQWLEEGGYDAYKAATGNAT